MTIDSPVVSVGPSPQRLKPFTAGRLLALCGAGVFLWALIGSVCLCFGSTGFGWPRDPVVLGLRFHWMLDASLIGAALAAAGVTYQAVLRNPLAEPSLLGVSSGAALAVYLWGLPSITLWPIFEAIGDEGCAFAGAMAALGVVFVLAQNRGRLEPVKLLLVGVIVNAICGAFYLLLAHLNLHTDRSGAQAGGPFRFLAGGINTSLTSSQERLGAFVVLVAWIALLMLSGALNVARLSEGEAHALGVRITRLRWIALVAASLAAAAAVSMSGPIAFIGLICPHLARLIVGHDQRRLFPVATALGAALLTVADTVSRHISPSTYGPLPVGVLTSMLGGPFFLYLLWRTRNRGVV